MDDRLQEAIAEIRSGNPQAGYHLLTEVIRANPRGRDAEAAWLLMSIIVADPEKKRQSLEAVLLLNPDNENAKERLAKLDSLTETVETSKRCWKDQGWRAPWYAEHTCRGANSLSNTPRGMLRFLPISRNIRSRELVL
jgi:hypothetical protein